MASPADPAQRHPACVACKRSKRKCSKQLPTCRRCRVQNLRCAYPVTVARAMLPHSPQSLTQTSASQSPATAGRQVRGTEERPGQSYGAIHHASEENLWFLVPASWLVDHVHIGDDDRITYPDSGLDYFVDRLRTWLDQWARENHCAFVHSRLYGSDLPGPLQHALAAWQVYRAASNPASKRIALRMAADWSQNLVRERATPGDMMGMGFPPESDLLDQLGSTLALVIFQVIGLFDGDVRARASAEGLLSTATRWADALMANGATATASNPLVTPGELLNSPQINQLRSDGTAASTWKAWLLSESIRRLWIVATLSEAAFLIWKQGYATCPGSIGFTARSGLWDALSPGPWLAALEGGSTTDIPVFCKGLDRLLDTAEPADVDDFTQALLAYGRGREVLEDWLACE